jgi:hypothetical protein
VLDRWTVGCGLTSTTHCFLFRCSVEDSLRETFVQPEILRVSEGNGWRPSKDAEKVDAYKGLSLRREGLPSLLQLHLKRFKYDWETGETSKINDRCSFPLVSNVSIHLCFHAEAHNLNLDLLYSSTCLE